MGLIVRPFDGDAETWNRFGADQPGWTAFHAYEWREVIGTVFGHACPYLAAYRDDALVGVLPLVAVRSRLFGRYLMSMPFLNYGGPLGEPEAIRALVAEAARLGRASGSDLTEFRSAVELPVDLSVSRRKITVVLELPGDGDSLMKRFPAKLRSQVRRPIKEGVDVKFGPEQLDAFFFVFSRHMRDLGTPTLPKAWFRAILRHLGETAWLGVAYLGQEPVAGGIGFRWGREFEMTWASSRTEFNRVAPNMILYFRFMERAIAAGLDRFNFGRCTPGSGTHRFKSQWGGVDVPLHWYQADGGVRGATPSPSDGAFSWGPRLWKRLPIGVANLVGPRIVRFLP